MTGPNIYRARPMSDIVVPVGKLYVPGKGVSQEDWVETVVDSYGSLHVIPYDEQGRVLVSQEGALFTLDKVIDYTQPLIDGDLAADGIQWGAGNDGLLGSVTTITVNTWYEAFLKQINPHLPRGGVLLWAELGLTAEFSSNNDNSTGEWYWQISNDGVTWSNLHAVVTETDIDTAATGAIQRTRSGYPRQYPAFDNTPFWVRLMMQCTSVNDTVTARIKNSSYIRMVYMPR